MSILTTMAEGWRPLVGRTRRVSGVGAYSEGVVFWTRSSRNVRQELWYGRPRPALAIRRWRHGIRVLRYTYAARKRKPVLRDATWDRRTWPTEWAAAALRWLAQQPEHAGLCVGVPGDPREDLYRALHPLAYARLGCTPLEIPGYATPVFREEDVDAASRRVWGRAWLEVRADVATAWGYRVPMRRERLEAARQAQARLFALYVYRPWGVGPLGVCWPEGAALPMSRAAARRCRRLLRACSDVTRAKMAWDEVVCAAHKIASLDRACWPMPNLCAATPCDVVRLLVDALRHSRDPENTLARMVAEVERRKTHSKRRVKKHLTSKP